MHVHILVGSISFYQYQILMHVWLGRSIKVVKMSDFKLFFTKKRFSQNRVFDTSSNLRVTDLKNRATLSLTFFCLFYQVVFLGPQIELDMKLNFLMTQRPFCIQQGAKKQRFFENLRKNIHNFSKNVHISQILVGDLEKIIQKLCLKFQIKQQSLSRAANRFSYVKCPY